jgi:hypothetical protein
VGRSGCERWQQHPTPAFSISGVELGGGNSDAGLEVFYLLLPAAVTFPGRNLALYLAQQFAGSKSQSRGPWPTPGTASD